MKLKAVMACVCLSVSLLLGGCNNIKQDTTTETKNTQTEEKAESNEEASKDIFAMDTYMTVTAYGAKRRKRLTRQKRKSRDWMNCFRQEMKRVRLHN